MYTSYDRQHHLFWHCVLEKSVNNFAQPSAVTLWSIYIWSWYSELKQRRNSSSQQIAQEKFNADIDLLRTQAGARVAVIPFDAEESFLYRLLDELDGVLFTGGGLDMTLNSTFDRVQSVGLSSIFDPVVLCCEIFTMLANWGSVHSHSMNGLLFQIKLLLTVYNIIFPFTIIHFYLPEVDSVVLENLSHHLCLHTDCHAHFSVRVTSTQRSSGGYVVGHLHGFKSCCRWAVTWLLCQPIATLGPIVWWVENN